MVRLKRQAAGHHRPFAQTDRPGRKSGQIVHAVDAFDRKALEQPLLHHHPATAQLLLGRLKDESDPAGEVTGFRQVPCCAQQRMVVWPSWPQACILPSCAERCSKSLNSDIGSASRSALKPIIRALPPRPSSRPTTPVPARPRCTSRPQAAQLFGNDIGRALLFECDLRVLVDVAPPSLHVLRELGNPVDDRHGKLLRLG